MWTVTSALGIGLKCLEPEASLENFSTCLMWRIVSRRFSSYLSVINKEIPSVKKIVMQICIYKCTVFNENSVFKFLTHLI